MFLFRPGGRTRYSSASPRMYDILLHKFYYPTTNRCLSLIGNFSCDSEIHKHMIPKHTKIHIQYEVQKYVHIGTTVATLENV